MRERILILDDESSICVSLYLALRGSYEVIYETDPLKGLAHLNSEPVDLVLLDLVIGSHDGLDILDRIRQIDPRIVVIMMTAYGSIRSSVSAMRRGAFNYLTKPLDLEELQIFIQQALQFRSLHEDVDYLNEQLQNHSGANDLIGLSPGMQRVLAQIEKFSRIDSHVLLYGESGSGKSLVAQALHRKSRRKHFVWVNCNNSEEDILAELFGRRQDPLNRPRGLQRSKFDLADQGTLYLEDIDKLTPTVQTRLLQVLQEQAFSPSGSQEVHRIDLRIIASSKNELWSLVADKQFDQDLYYRLNSIEIQLPPLRERREDIPLLCEHFIKHSPSLQSKSCPVRGLSPEVLDFLKRYDFPGNVRELANAIDYAGILANGPLIQARDLPYRLTETASPAAPDLAGKTLQEIEKQAVIAAFHRHNGKRKAIAAELGISERGLWNKLRDYGLSS